MARLIIGKHPLGATGLFISRPGVAVENTSPDDTSNLLFSTNWAQVANIIASGPCNLDDVVTLPNVGFRPFVRWEAQYTVNGNTTYDAYPSFGVTQSTSNAGDQRRYDYTRFILVYSSDTTFKITKRFPSLDNFPGEGTLTFRYVAFSLPVNS